MADEIKLEIRNVKFFQGTEGYGFNATLYVNGIKTAFVIDDANGGCYNYQVFDKDAFATFSKYVKTLPPMSYDIIAGMEGETYPQDEDTVMNRLVEDWELNTKIKRLCKKKTVYSKKGETDIYSINVEYSTTVKQKLIEKYGEGIKIYNEMF